MIALLAALCSAAAVWTFLTPPTAVHRLNRLLTHPPANPFLLIKARAISIRDRRSLPHRWRTSIIELCDAMAAELTAGRTPDEAFTAATAVLDPHIAAELLSLP
ncbi:type II secretion system protein, partial [Actinomadura sp. KC216]